MNSTIRVAKYQGCGNDFVILPQLPDSSNCAIQDRPQFATRVLDRHFGIGADQLLVIQASHKADFGVAIYNPDGSEAGSCGNGMRCVAQYIEDVKLLGHKPLEVSLEVQDRIVTCRYNKDLSTSGLNYISVNMGKPNFTPECIPTTLSHEILGLKISVLRQDFYIHALSMGNPHCIIFVPDLAQINIHQLGPALENHAIFPQRANIEFVQVLTPERLKGVVWERGTGVTLACGSGACAILAAAHRAGFAARTAEIVLPGGTLKVFWDQASNNIMLTGPAKFVAWVEYGAHN